MSRRSQPQRMTAPHNSKRSAAPARPPRQKPARHAKPAARTLAPQPTETPGTADASVAARALAQLDEVQKWKNLANCGDLRLEFGVMKYLTDRRDGRPAQVASPGDEELDPRVVVDL